MNADTIPIEIALILSIEFIFGIGYNAIVVWAHKNNLMHVSQSVALGVAITLLIPALAWFDHEMQFWQAGFLLVGCFIASGVPMIVASMRRTAEKKDDKKRRPWPTAAMRVRDDAVMELMSIAHDIAERARANELRVIDLPSYVNRLHGVIGMLKSV